MIAVETVYDTLLSLIREDKRGNAISPDEFNRLSKLVNERVFQKKYAGFETSTENIGALARFKEIEVPLVLAAGSTSLPSNYREIIGKPRITDSLGMIRRCDLISQLELDERSDDYLTMPIQTYPVYTLGELDGSDNIIMHVYPATITGNVTIDYLKNPTVPYYDYYTNNTTLVVVYMDTSTVPAIASGNIYRDGTAGDGVTTFTSLSADWEWDEGDLMLILTIFAEMLGIALPDQFLVEVGNAEEVKNS
jgi:hypothetical protein